MEDLNFRSNSHDLQEGRRGKEMDALEGEINMKDIQGVDHGELLKPEVHRFPLVTAGDCLEENDSQIAKCDHIDPVQKDSGGFNQEASKMLNVEYVKHDVSEATFGSCHDLHEATKSPESFTEKDADSLDRELRDLTQSEESWKQMTCDSDTEEDYVQIGKKRNYSDLSTVRAESTDASNVSLADSDSFILDVEGLEPEVDTDGEYLLPCDSLSSDIEEFMETSDRGMEDFGQVPMESPHVSLVSNKSQMLTELGAGATAFCSLNFGITGADWHMALLPVKCLETGAVNVASLTLGTVGISVIPMVSPGTIDINPFTTSIGRVPAEPTDWETWSMDSMPLATTSAEYVNVDSITPEGVRECWHPLEDRLHALGEALTALDKKIEGFSPRIQEAEMLLNEVELSVSHHAMHISAIMKENNALAERVLLLEERLSREKQQIWVKNSEEEA